MCVTDLKLGIPLVPLVPLGPPLAVASSNSAKVSVGCLVEYCAAGGGSSAHLLRP
jgi:hypothetical protein